MTTLETRCVLAAYEEEFNYYAYECLNNWLAVAIEFFTEEHGAEECGKVDWRYVKAKTEERIAI